MSESTAGLKDLATRLHGITVRVSENTARVEDRLRNETDPDQIVQQVEHWKRLKEASQTLATDALTVDSKLHLEEVAQHLHKSVVQMKTIAVEQSSADGEVAVKVDLSGQLIDLRLEPGILARRTAAEIAGEVTRLVTTAGQEAAKQAEDVFRRASQIPEFEPVATKAIGGLAAPGSARQSR
ncbi:YbaB/EbfC family nucleoid-associated protein [Mycobacterium sp. MS1601]|uniref:YbaB/EbfC family nucleoid-associated protein n=1 Tax=Mycobacterium sp. MS1601 TaxID=1936029 RepID=UPI0012FC090F|nr:YbaB/EbfC family nucleoid-associated protein [Mycobacterium sp. MS1601]